MQDPLSQNMVPVHTDGNWLQQENLEARAPTPTQPLFNTTNTNCILYKEEGLIGI